MECEVRQSRIRNSGYGVFLVGSVAKGQILLRYGGRKISLLEADSLIEQVFSSTSISFLKF